MQVVESGRDVLRADSDCLVTRITWYVVNGSSTVAKKKAFRKCNTKRTVLRHMNIELYWRNIAEAEHRAPDRLIRR